MCMSGEWPTTQGAIFKRLPTLFTVALISRAAHTRVHTFICACYHVDEVCNAATSLKRVLPEGKRFSQKQLCIPKLTQTSGTLHGGLGILFHFFSWSEAQLNLYYYFYYPY